MDSSPAFSLPATGGLSFDPTALSGRGAVLYFYPKDNTPGCTSEGQAFAALHDQFRAAGFAVYGLSRDSLKSHENFKARQGFPFDLVSDPEEVACTAFAVMKLKNLYGKQVRGVERSTFVLAADGRILQAWRGVKVPGHAEAVLAFVRSL